MTKTSTGTDRIEKTVVLKAPRSRVWRAIADADQFGQNDPGWSQQIANIERYVARA